MVQTAPPMAARAADHPVEKLAVELARGHVLLRQLRDLGHQRLDLPLGLLDQLGVDRLLKLLMRLLAGPLRLPAACRKAEVPMCLVYSFFGPDSRRLRGAAPTMATQNIQTPQPPVPYGPRSSGARLPPWPFIKGTSIFHTGPAGPGRFLYMH